MLPTTCSTVVRRCWPGSRSAAPSAPCCRRRWRAGQLRWLWSKPGWMPCLRARIGVLDRLGVRGRQVIEFVHAIADGSGLPLHIFLARERIDLAPETFSECPVARPACRWRRWLRRRHSGQRTGRRRRVGLEWWNRSVARAGSASTPARSSATKRRFFIILRPPSGGASGLHIRLK